MKLRIKIRFKFIKEAIDVLRINIMNYRKRKDLAHKVKKNTFLKNF